MKLIMESWRHFVDEQKDREVISEGEKLADDLIVGSEKEQLNEELITATLLLPFFLKMIAGAALSGAVAKLGSALQRRITGQESDFLEGAAKFFEEATKIMATVGITKGATKLVNWYFAKKCKKFNNGRPCASSDEWPAELKQSRRKWLARIDLTEKTVTMAVLLFVSANELVSAAKEAGGLANAVGQFFTNAGFENESARSALIDALGTSLDAGGAAGQTGEIGTKVASMTGGTVQAKINKAMFFAGLTRFIKTLWSGKK